MGSRASLLLIAVHFLVHAILSGGEEDTCARAQQLSREGSHKASWPMFAACFSEIDERALSAEILSQGAQAARYAGEFGPCVDLSESALSFETGGDAQVWFAHYEILTSCLHHGNRSSEVMAVHHRAVAAGIYPSGDPKRPGGGIIYLRGLRARRFWKRQQLSKKQRRMLEYMSSIGAAALIDAELQRASGDGLRRVELPEPDALIRSGGSWTQIIFYEKGRRHDAACLLFPTPCRIVEKYEGVLNAGSVKLSILQPGSHIIPHAGSSNAVLRGHLTIRGAAATARLTVAGRRAPKWEAGGFFVFDDVYEHQVDYPARGSQLPARVVLIMDLWHPKLPKRLRRQIIRDRVAVQAPSGVASTTENVVVTEQPLHEEL